MKKEVGILDATPTKRLFLSIIVDYNLNGAICELIDNALDIWSNSGEAQPLDIHIDLDDTQQTIRVEDNAGGVRRDDLRFIVGPGQTGNDPDNKSIGIFGVGTKRAVVALAQDIRITTRHQNKRTFQVEFDENWIEEVSWELPVYQVDPILNGTTIINLSRLRFQITQQSKVRLKNHLEATYAKFLDFESVQIKLDGELLKPKTFDDWSYPPKYSPRLYIGEIPSEDGGSVGVEILAGLSNESSPAGGEYGVYFYCNNRLVGRALKTFEFGFTKGLAGLPHPSVSLTRVIISLSGPARLMPWDSSKSGIYTSHPIFESLRGELVEIVKDFASLSRRWEGRWPEEVFKYASGNITEVKIDDFPNARKSYLPPLPKSRPRYSDRIAQANRGISTDKPWVTGLYESIIAVDSISKQRLKQKNRIGLILLDSTLEIALKNFLVNESGPYYSDSQLLSLFKNRADVIKEVLKYKKINKKNLKKINHYYSLRNKLVHERADIAVDDDSIDDYREVVEQLLKQLFGLKF